MTKQYVEFHRWPDDLAARYVEKGYWAGQPLTRGVAFQAAMQPDAVALICGHRVISYDALNRQADHLAARLAVDQFGHGDTALIQLPNLAEFYIVFLALLKVGVVPVNALYAHRSAEMTAYATQVQPTLLIADRAHELFQNNDFIQRLTEVCPLRRHLWLNPQGGDDSLARWMAHPPDHPVNYGPTPADQVALFQLSGGSTGTPKLIPRTHDDYEYSIRESARICQLSETTRFLIALPAGHNFLLSSPGALGVFFAGGTVVLAKSPDPANCFDLIHRHQVTMAALVPPAAALWVEAAHQAPVGHFVSLSLIQIGGASLAEPLARRVPEVFGCALQQVFGMAEGLVNYTRLDDNDDVVFNTQGRPISPDDELRILDEDGSPVPDGTPGMLATRGPYTFRGYHKSPEHNAQSFDAEGFYYSGDVVVRRNDGNLRVVGRVKDQINRGGEKIAAAEVEAILLRHPLVTHAALISMPDAHMGEKSCAVLVIIPEAGRADIAMPVLRRWLLAQGLAEYKLPDRVRLAEKMPLTAVGKIDKRALQAQYAPPVS